MKQTPNFPRTIAALAGATLAMATTASAQEPEPIAVELLTERHEFTDGISGQIVLGIEGRDRDTVEIDDFSRMVTARLTIQPGAMFPWHTHPGPILVPVTQGELVFIYADDCVERPYPTGTAFVDTGENVHTAVNPSSDEEAVVIATFLGATKDGLLTIPVEDDEAASLNEKCGTGGR